MLNAFFSHLVAVGGSVELSHKSSDRLDSHWALVEGSWIIDVLVSNNLVDVNFLKLGRGCLLIVWG